MIMAIAAEKLFTIHDYRRMEDDGKRYEVINGELLMSPSPNLFHQRISRNLCRIIYSWLHEHKIGQAFAAPLDVYLDEYNVVQPDIVYVARENIVKLERDGVHGAPDLSVEILSPSTSKRDLRDKRELYARCGVIEFWIISPETRQLQIYDLPRESSRPTRILEESDTAETPLLPGLRFPVAEIFAD